MHYEVLKAMCAMTQKYSTPNGSKERKEHQRETPLSTSTTVRWIPIRVS